jgi:acyl-coenzyme A thioesterase PaaI-like protein
VHGGLAATLLDSAMGCAVHSMLPVDVSYTTIEIKLTLRTGYTLAACGGPKPLFANYLRALTSETGTVRAEGHVIKVGGRVAIAEGRITDAAGNLYTHGTTTCLILRLER